MARRPRRHIVSDSFAFDCVNYAADDSKVAMRILLPITTLESEAQERLAKSESSLFQLLYTTTQLAHSRESESIKDIKYVFDIDGVRHFVAMEAIMDVTDRMYVRFWQPMGNIICAVNLKEGHLRFEDSSRYTTTTFFKTNEYAWHQELVTIGQIFCRDATDKPKNCAMSFVSKPNGKIITKIEYDEPTTADYVNNVHHSSRYLNIVPVLTAPATCKPNELVTINVQFYQGGTENKIKGVNWEGLVVEAVDGYTPHKRCKIVDGKGSFKARALDLLPGEEMRIKVGTKTFSAKGQCIIKVV